MLHPAVQRATDPGGEVIWFEHVSEAEHAGKTRVASRRNPAMAGGRCQL